MRNSSPHSPPPKSPYDLLSSAGQTIVEVITTSPAGVLITKIVYAPNSLITRLNPTPRQTNSHLPYYIPYHITLHIPDLTLHNHHYKPYHSHSRHSHPRCHHTRPRRPTRSHNWHSRRCHPLHLHNYHQRRYNRHRRLLHPLLPRNNTAHPGAGRHRARLQLVVVKIWRDVHHVCEYGRSGADA